MLYEHNISQVLLKVIWISSIIGPCLCFRLISTEVPSLDFKKENVFFWLMGWPLRTYLATEGKMFSNNDSLILFSIVFLPWTWYHWTDSQKKIWCWSYLDPPHTNSSQSSLQKHHTLSTPEYFSILWNEEIVSLGTPTNRNKEIDYL